MRPRRRTPDIVRSLPAITDEQARLIFRLGRLYEPNAPFDPEQRLFPSDIDRLRSLPSLTCEQWQLIYETERYFADTSRPVPQERKLLFCDVYEHIRDSNRSLLSLLSARTKTIAVAYLLGCLVVYSGAYNAIVGIWDTGTLRFRPESNLFAELLEAVVVLLRPLMAVLVVWMTIMWGLLIPVVGILSGVDGARSWIARSLKWLRA